MSLLSCRVCFIFCVNASLFLTSCFSSFVLLFFLHHASSSFWPFFFIMSFASFVASFLIRLFFYFSFLCISLFYPSCNRFSFSSKSVSLCLFRFCHFPSVFYLFQQNISSLLSHSLCFSTFFSNKSFFSRHLISFLVLLANKKISLFKFPF